MESDALVYADLSQMDDCVLESNEYGYNLPAPNEFLPQCSDIEAALAEEFWKRPQSPVFMDDEDSRDSGYGSSQGKVETSSQNTFQQHRVTFHHSASAVILQVPSPQFSRCLSESEVGEVAILSAIQKAEENKGLIGDFSGAHVLPLIKNPRIHDLMCVGAQTVCDILNDRFAHVIENFVLIDCRYPYEYAGGHIRTAVNMFSPCQMTDFLNNNRLLRQPVDAENNPTTAKRNVVLFYCEFSKERGPKMCRFLRAYDRRKNEYRYPCLDYPEIYLIEGGYKNFYAECQEYCEPQTYKPMDHADHSEDLRKFRIKSKSWSTFATVDTLRSDSASGSFGRDSQNHASDASTPQKSSMLRRGLFKQDLLGLH